MQLDRAKPILFGDFLLTQFEDVPIGTIFRYNEGWFRKSSVFTYQNRFAKLFSVGNGDFIVGVYKTQMPETFAWISKIDKLIPNEVCHKIGTPNKSYDVFCING